MITGSQLRGARGLLGISQRTLADKAGVSLPTVQRMEASRGNVRGIVETLTRIVATLDEMGVELLGENAVSSSGGRGVRLKSPEGTGTTRKRRR
jgi:predicted transcriptional regulator